MPPSRAERAGAGVLGAVLLFVALFLIAEAGRLALADFLNESSDPADWERAAKLEPGNAAHWYRLARYRQWDFQNADLRRAIEYYERATDSNPHSAFYWLDLASAYEMAADSVRARRAFETARSAYPISAEVAWNYGNFLLREGNLPEALAEIRRATNTDRKFEPLAVSVCWRAGLTLDEIFETIVTPDITSYLGVMDFFLREGDVDSALRTWARVQSLHEHVELARSFPLIDELVHRERAADALSVWQQALLLARRMIAPVLPGSVIWDGGFEDGFPDGGFGWRRVSIAGASMDVDSSVRRSGASALRVRFDGSANVSFQNVRQLVTVEPRTRYRFQAFVRCDGISTDSGLRFRVFDNRQPATLNAETGNLTGTLPGWTAQEVEFVTGSDTRLLNVALIRRPSRKLDNKLSGTIWVDDVSLVPVESASPQVKP